MKIAILGSTRGTDMQAIIDAIESKRLKDIEISFVLSDKVDAYILERAKKHGLDAIYMDSKGKKREEYDNIVTELLEKSGVELVLLIGYMRIMGEKFVKRWENKVMNIHPSILPAFAGGMDKNVHEGVLARGCKISGATLIFIDEGADTGPIIMQRAVEVKENDTVDSLKERVQLKEQEMLVESIALYRDGKIRVENGRVFIERQD